MAIKGRQRPLRFGPGPRGDFTAPEDDHDEPRRTLSDGTQIYPSYRNLKPNGQQEGYVVLAEEERANGFVRPVRRSYKHLKCGSVTTMAKTIAETLARDPTFYSGGFCANCRAHFPNAEFAWPDDGTQVGT